MSKDFRLKLFKSIFHSIKPKCIFFGIIFVTLLFINFYGSYKTWIAYRGEDIAQKEYGTYRFTVIEIDAEQVEKVKSEVKDTSVTFSSEIGSEGMICIYADENYTNISNCKIVKGSFPQKQNEIMCESRYLLNRGIKFDGTSVELIIDGKKYTVTGEIIYNESSINVSMYVPVIVANLKYAKIEDDSTDYSVLCGGFSEKNFAESADIIKKKCNLDDSNIHYNNNYLVFMDIDEFGQSNSIFIKVLDVIFYPLVFICSFVFAFGFYLITQKLRAEFLRMRLLGINVKELYKTMAFFMFIVFVFSCLLTIFVSVLVGNIITDSNVFKKIDWVTIILINIIYSFLSIGFSLLFIAKDSRKKLLEQVRNQNKKEIKNKKMSYIEKAKFPFWRVASINIKLKKSYIICSIVCIGISIVMMGAFLYCAFFIEGKNVEKEYDYRIEYCYTNWADQFDGSKQNYDMFQRIKNEQDLFEIFPVFYNHTTVELRKNNFSPEMIEFIKSTDSESNKELDHIDRSFMKVSGCIFGANVDELKKVYGITDVEEELADNECIVLENIITKNGDSIYTGISEGKTVRKNYLEIVNDEDIQEKRIDFKVKKTVSNLDLKGDKYSGCFTFIVNHKVYALLSSYKYDYPELIYLNAKNGTDAQIRDMFFGETELYLVNQTQEMESRQEYLNFIYLIVYGFFAILLIIVVFYTLLTFISIYNNNLKQTAIFKGLGLSDKKLFFTNGYVVIRNALDALIIGNGLLFVTLYFIYKYINNNFYSITFTLPKVSIVVIPNAIISSFMILSYVYMFIKIKKMDTVAVLKEDC